MKILDSLSDRLNPFVVKELRQELKLKGFVHLFVWPQLLLLAALALDLSVVQSSGFRSQLTSSAFYMTVGFVLFIYSSRRAMVSFAKEIEASSLELLHLTKVTSFGILFGKWIALSLQGVLLVVALLPYAFIQYFLGSVELAGLVGTATATVVSFLLLMAMLVSASAANRGRAGGPVLFMVILVVLALPSFLTSIFSPGGSSLISRLILQDPLDLLIYVAIYSALLSATIALILFHGASKIAPHFEDYSALRRAVTLLLVLLSIAAAFIAPISGNGIDGLLTLTVAIVLPLVVLSIVEEPHPLLLRKGYSVRNALLHRGWVGGTLTSLVLSAVLAAAFLGLGANFEHVAGVLIIGLGIVLLPRLLMSMAPSILGERLMGYLTIQGLMLVIPAISLLPGDRGLDEAARIFPLFGLLQWAADSGSDIGDLMPAMIVCLLAIGGTIWRVYAETRRREKLE